MEKLKVTLTEDMIKLISCINFQEYERVTDETEKHEVFYAIDLNSLYGGNFVFEDIDDRLAKTITKIYSKIY